MSRGSSPLRAALHRAVDRAWQRRGLLARALLPLAALHRAWRALRSVLRLLGYQRPVRVGVPVLVVGNITVGGTGKTPLVAELVRALRARGWRPGIVSRGHGGQGRIPALVDASGDTDRFGDEPVLLRHLAAVPVAVGADRVAAARLLRSLHPECDLIIADDGLQHRRLARDVELCLLGGRGLGNGWLLPAGPLRDPAQRLASIDAAVLHGIVPPVRIQSPFFRMQSQPGEAFSFTDASQSIALAELAAQQAREPLRVLAVCAIGSPERYFSMLRDQGLEFTARALPDHDPLGPAALRGGPWDRILITEKDAVKCAQDAALAQDRRLWVVPLHTSIEPGLVDFVERRLRAAVPVAPADPPPAG